MVTMYDEGAFEFELREERRQHGERTIEVLSLFEEIERAHIERMTSAGAGTARADWFEADNLEEERNWGLDWLWGLDEDSWYGQVVHEEARVQRVDWELWSDLDPSQELEEGEVDVYREYIEEDEAQERFIDDLDHERWSNPMRTTHTRAGLLEALDHLDHWDVRVEFERNESWGIEQVVVTSLSGAWDSFEVRWKAQERYEPLS